MIDINCIGSEEITPVTIAAKYNSLEALRLLILRNCSLGITNSNGETALHYASRFGNVESCRVCIYAVDSANFKYAFISSM